MLASLPAACGSSTPASGVDPETTLSEATERTLAEGSAHIHAYSPSDRRSGAPEWDTRGDISFTKQEARLTEGGELLYIYKPYAIWKRGPEAAVFAPGKKWLRLPRPGGGSVIDDRIRLQVYLAAGVTLSAAPEESEIAGVETRHYDTHVDVGQALKAVPEETRLLAEDALKSELLGETGRVEFWIDLQGRLRRIQVTVPPGRVYSYSGPDGSRKRLESVATLISTLDYSDFGVDVDTTPPPDEEVADPAKP